MWQKIKNKPRQRKIDRKIWQFQFFLVTLHAFSKAGAHAPPYSDNTINKIYTIMKALLKNLGVILAIIGVLMLVIYYFAVQTNTLLVLSIVFEVAGILSYIFINKYID